MLRGKIKYGCECLCAHFSLLLNTLQLPMDGVLAFDFNCLYKAWMYILHFCTIHSVLLVLKFLDCNCHQKFPDLHSQVPSCNYNYFQVALDYGPFILAIGEPIKPVVSLLSLGEAAESGIWWIVNWDLTWLCTESYSCCTRTSWSLPVLVTKPKAKQYKRT